MKFIVKRKSSWMGEKPCDEAVEVKNGPRAEWVVSISSLKALSEFVEKYGSVVLLEKDDGCSKHVLEIYDDYRE